MRFLPENYITSAVAKNTKYKSLQIAYEKNLISIIQDGGIFYVEGYGCPDRTYEIAIRETKRLFPDLRYLHDPR